MHMPAIVLWSWELAPDLSPKKAKDAYREVLKCDPCSYCGEHDPESHVDHIDPLSGRGRDDWENLTAACRKCNSAKKNKPLLTVLLGEPVGAGYARWLELQAKTYEWIKCDNRERKLREAA